MVLKGEINMRYKYFWLYVLFWIVLAQTINLEVVLVGILVCSLIFLFNEPLINAYPKNKSISILILNIKYSILYISVLVEEIFKSNLHVAKIVLSPKLNISPSVVIINTKLKNELNKIILANSITLTPGTLTLDLYDDKLVVHCLDLESAGSVENNCFERILLKKEEINND